MVLPISMPTNMEARHCSLLKRAMARKEGSNSKLPPAKNAAHKEQGGKPARASLENSQPGGGQ